MQNEITLEPSSERLRALVYARVSSKEQEKEGFSIPAQLKLLQTCADERRMTVVKAFVDNETAKETGRTNFGEMLRYLKEHRTIDAVLVEKTDRLYRNLKDWVSVDELDVEIHLVKEGVVLSRDSRSSEKFVHGIKVLMAKNYVDNLSEETKKGMKEKAEQGIWPSVAPAGYVNVLGPDGKKIIEVDPKLGPVVGQMFGWYGTGNISLKALCLKAAEAGYVSKTTGKPIAQSQAQAILTNRIYTGGFDWNGEYYRGKHAQLVSAELFERVQGALSARNARKLKSDGPREFAFSGVMSCGYCGCSLVGELKKRKYTYYHCTGKRGECPKPYVREEVIEAQFAAALGRLNFGEHVRRWVVQALRESKAVETKDHGEAVTRLQAEYERLQRRIEAVYVDKLEGQVDRGMFKQLTKSWRIEQTKIIDQIEFHQHADQSYMEEGERLLDVACRAEEIFKTREALQKRQMLKFLCSNSTWRDGQLTPQWRQPFEMIAETAAIAARENAKNGVESALHTEWLPGLGSNQRHFD